MKKSIPNLHCKHYNGLYGPGMKKNKTCRKGVDYEKFRVKDQAFIKTIPCINEAIASCSLREYKTPEELEAEEKEMEALLQNTTKVLHAIQATGQASGTIPCPVCRTGTVNFSRAELNNHLHAGCSTEGCVRFME